MNAATAIWIEQHLTLILMFTGLVFTKLMMLTLKDKARFVHEQTIMVKKGRYEGQTR